MKYEGKIFLKSFVQQPNIVGSVIPSSKYLCNSMLKNIDFKDCNCIVEYGAGTGIFTKEICRRKKKNTLFISFELNRGMYNSIKELHSPKDKIYIIHDSAENLMKYLDRYQIDSVDYFISGLPFAILPKEVSNKILDNTFLKLKDDGEFIMFQYSFQYLNTLKSTFPQLRLGFQPLNFPPAFIYYCRKIKS
ncbi:class I SAM-dependent methyltransferase [Clostridium formicaceticum]|uniref:SAM-dependent methyltransferase n=1 Tax=Clostridium formicaceticum TaxID=1497 RepID=A0AAC9RNY9_9CLOT|nr:rRNA adenine N-6-methyltransferase family protein [Clostridium formicaceticum]AOY77745.1 hypothetical protein BJL90_18910 [Clostridium formicaceticum]ARE88343.1 hypothetical protein CLFO_27440 [Clostridium formicaceticum]